MVETAFHLLQTSRVLFLSVFLLSLLITAPASAQSFGAGA